MDDHTRLAKKLERNPTALLRDDEVDTLVSEAHRLLGPQFSHPLTERPVQLEDLVRWGSLKTKCEQARALRRLSVKAAALQAKIPQYRIVAIESGRLRELVPELAWRYFDFLDIGVWVKKWIRANLDLATRSGIAVTIGGRKSSKRVNPTARPAGYAQHSTDTKDASGCGKYRRH